jgi:hypothetical protein
MVSNPITGRSFLFNGNLPDENESIDPDPGLSIAVFFFCLVGPFWLLYRLVATLAKKGISFMTHIKDANKVLPENSAID